MYTGEMISVSEQQLIDCDHAKPFEDLGCEGGDFTGELLLPLPWPIRGLPPLRLRSLFFWNLSGSSLCVTWLQQDFGQGWVDLLTGMSVCVHRHELIMCDTTASEV